MKMFGAGKARMIGLPYGEKKLSQYVKPFSSDTGTSRTDEWTDSRTELLYQYRASVNKIKSLPERGIKTCAPQLQKNRAPITV